MLQLSTFNNQLAVRRCTSNLINDQQSNQGAQPWLLYQNSELHLEVCEKENSIKIEHNLQPLFPPHPSPKATCHLLIPLLSPINAPPPQFTLHPHKKIEI